MRRFAWFKEIGAAFDLFAWRAMTINEWARARRVLPRGLTGKPGPWEPFPFQVEIMDAPHDSNVSSLVLMMASQVLGKTEVLNNIIGWAIECHPCGIIMVQPTGEMAKAWAKTKLNPMIRNTKEIRDVLIQETPRGKTGRSSKHLGEGTNTISLKQFPGGFLVTGTAASPTGLAMFACEIALFDEVNKYEPSAGNEGDPISLTESRTETFPNGFSVKTSTPTEPDARIELELAETDCRKWFVRCPKCGHEFVIMWPHIVWDKGPGGEHLTETAHLECPSPSCGARLSDEDRQAMVRAGRWIATRPYIKRKRGYHANAFITLLKCKRGYLNRLHQWAQEFLEKKAKGWQVYKTVITHVWAESAIEPAEKATAPEILFARREKFWEQDCPEEDRVLPKGVWLITVGADKQPDRIEAQVIGWGLGEESWSLDYRVFPGDFENRDFRDQINAWLLESWKHPGGLTLHCACACFDSGDRPRSVYRFVKECAPRAVYAVKGFGSMSIPWINGSKTTPRLLNLNVDVAKATIYSRLNIFQPGAGYMHFPLEYDLNYFEQLTSERIVTRRHLGQPIKRFELPAGKRNEVLDTWVYGFAAMERLRPNWRALAKLFEADEPPAESGPSTPPAPASPPPSAPSAVTARQQRPRSTWNIRGRF
jgi:phage terminase large subunit GpA-like protein